MKKTALGIVFLLFAIVSYVFYTFYSSGFFREIENTFAGSIERSVRLPGVEDMQISYEDDFMLLSSDDRASRRDGITKQGHLYYIDLTNTAFEPIRLTTNLNIPFFPHGISMIQSAPQIYKVYVVNHVNSIQSIEVFDLYKDSLIHIQTLKDASMVSPNDIVAIDEERFYFTNDHGFTKGLGKLGEEYLGWAVSNVIYFDGNTYREVADGIAYANGINLDFKRNLLFVASPRDFLVKVFQRKESGDLDFIEDIDCGTGVDNIEFAPDGKIWIGCHPSLLTFTAYANGDKPIAPSEIITIDYRGTGDYSKEIIFVDDGRNMSASTVAAVYNDYIFVGNVMDDHFLILKENE
ncbi:MAG: SMP-30/gluconolactonase/LRE family protein [Cyclobacteriaceae bacterium]|nr:SMP-30/gluconolactonase/LRE family protein [Cyclobacteriaceae bacterium]